jgi:hypothetical protein
VAYLDCRQPDAVSGSRTVLAYRRCHCSTIILTGNFHCFGMLLDGACSSYVRLQVTLTDRQPEGQLLSKCYLIQRVSQRQSEIEAGFSKCEDCSRAQTLCSVLHCSLKYRQRHCRPADDSSGSHSHSERHLKTYLDGCPEMSMHAT